MGPPVLIGVWAFYWRVGSPKIEDKQVPGRFISRFVSICFLFLIQGSVVGDIPSQVLVGWTLVRLGSYKDPRVQQGLHI